MTEKNNWKRHSKMLRVVISELCNYECLAFLSLYFLNFKFSSSVNWNILLSKIDLNTSMHMHIYLFIVINYT